MFYTFCKGIFRIALFLGAVFAVLAVLQYIDNKPTDYIEIYSDAEH